MIFFGWGPLYAFNPNVDSYDNLTDSEKVLVNQDSSRVIYHLCVSNKPSRSDLFCLPLKVQVQQHLTYLSCLVVEPHQSVIPGQHLAVEGGVVLGRATPGHGAPDLDRLIQVNMAFLKRV